MGSLIDTFLYLGREKQSTANDVVDIMSTLQRSLDKNAYLNEDKIFFITKNIAPCIVISNDSKLMQILFDNIIRNMYFHGDSKAIFTLNETSVIIENYLNQLDYSDPSVDSYGLKIIERISEYCSLKINFYNRNDIFKVTVFFHGEE